MKRGKSGPSRTEQLVEADRNHVWHPFTQMSCWLREEVVVIEKGRGCYLYDTEGRKYLDGVSSLWCNVHGHRVKEIDEAIRKQLDTIAHTTLLGLAGPPSIELAAALVKEAPAGLTRVFFSDNGSTAVEAAVKMALQYQQQTGRPEKNRFAGLVEAYHGDTVGSVSVGGMALFHAVFSPLRFDVVRIPAPHCYRCPENLERENCGMACARSAEKILARHAKKLAALVIEPRVQGAAGMIVHPHGYLKNVKRACEKHGILLIADEVATGFGRTGTMFACEHEGVTPDLLCLAKGLTGGYLPLAATMTTEKIFRAFLGPYASNKTFFHGHTYTGNALGCAAALASMGLLKKKALPALPEKIDRFSRLIEKQVKPLKHVGDVRQAGLMAGIELVRNKKSKTPYPFSKRMGHQVILEARKRGVMLRPLGNVVVLMPPLVISLRDIGTLVRVTAESIRAATET